jgi:hypothetical protein
MLTPDAHAQDEGFLERLTAPIRAGEAAIAYGRQLPRTGRRSDRGVQPYVQLPFDQPQPLARRPAALRRLHPFLLEQLCRLAQRRPRRDRRLSADPGERGDDRGTAALLRARPPHRLCRRGHGAPQPRHRASSPISADSSTPATPGGPTAASSSPGEPDEARGLAYTRRLWRISRHGTRAPALCHAHTAARYAGYRLGMAGARLPRRLNAFSAARTITGRRTRATSPPRRRRLTAMRVALVTNNHLPPREGIGRHVIELAKRLPAHGIEPIVVAKGKNLRFWHRLEVEGVPVALYPYAPVRPFHQEAIRAVLQPWLDKGAEGPTSSTSICRCCRGSRPGCRASSPSTARFWPTYAAIQRARPDDRHGQGQCPALRPGLRARPDQGRRRHHRGLGQCRGRAHPPVPARRAHGRWSSRTASTSTSSPATDAAPLPNDADHPLCRPARLPQGPRPAARRHGPPWPTDSDWRLALAGEGPLEARLEGAGRSPRHRRPGRLSGLSRPRGPARRPACARRCWSTPPTTRAAP